jgi:hypothetical protein
MASLSHRIRAFLASPKGQQLIEKGQRQPAKPENQQKIRNLLSKLRGRR